MNAEVAHAYRERKREAEPLGEDAYQLRALQHLKLKTVVKVGCRSDEIETPRNSRSPSL